RRAGRGGPRTLLRWVGGWSKTVVAAPSLAKITGSQPPPAARPSTRAPSSRTPLSRPRGSMKRLIPARLRGGRPRGRVYIIPTRARRSHIRRLWAATGSLIDATIVDYGVRQPPFVAAPG